MTDEKDMKEVIDEMPDEIEVDGQETNWTSFDLYYKGFHIKKSLPKNVKLSKITKLIEKAIDLGYEPSWNADTNKKQDPIQKVTSGVGESQNCPTHGDPMKQAKSGKWYHIDETETNMCMGKNWFPLRKKND